jgi:membrane protease YdiL (CAAX protease family)
MSAYETLVRSLPLALAEARRSPMIDGPRVDHPWRRLASFIGLAVLLTLTAAVILAMVMVLVPDLADLLRTDGPLPDTNMRLFDEALYVLAAGPVLGSLALAILAAAAITYRLRPTDFLWPGRAFNARDLGVGLLAMSCLGVMLIPWYLLTGSEWSPPLLDPLYADWTRPVFLVATVVGLLIAAFAEEVVCRGVLLRLTAQANRHPLVLCLINGVIFSALHLDPDPVGFVARALSGMVWTWAALRLGGLEFATGAHLANNLIISLFWSPLSEAEVGRDSQWIELAPEVLTAVVILAITERLARGPREWPLRPLAPGGPTP